MQSSFGLSLLELPCPLVLSNYDPSQPLLASHAAEPLTAAMSDPFLYFDDTNPDLIYSANQWFDNAGIEGAFNNTLSSTTSVGATVKVQFVGACWK